MASINNSLFRSHLEFGILAWGGVPTSKLKSIINLQKKCVRNVAGKSYRSHTDPIFSKLNILKFTDLFNYNCSAFMHKIILNKQPESFNGMFTPLFTPNRTKNFHTVKHKNDYMLQFPSILLPKIWNANNLELKNNESHPSMKKSLYNSIVSSYNPIVHCREAGCPDCN